MLEFIKKMLEYSSEKNGISYKKMQEYCNLYASDRRYKPYLNACTCSCYFNQTGYITYRYMRYYYMQNDKNSVLVEIA